MMLENGEVPGGAYPRWNSRCTAEATLTGALTGFWKAGNIASWTGGENPTQNLSGITRRKRAVVTRSGG